MVNNNDITNTFKNSIFSDTVLHAGSWKLILVVSDATFTRLDDEALEFGSYNGKTYTKGTQLPGNFTALQLSAGEVIAYA